LPITFNTKFLIPVLVIAALSAGALPPHASAFSLFGLFSTNADAAIGSDSGTTDAPLLAAAINSDPNPNKGLADTQTISDNALVAHNGPQGSLADVASSTPPDRISVYVVRPGDTLGEIAQMFNVSVNTIIWANNLSSSKDFHVGDTLIILPISGVKRTIVAGDTLQSIAKKYGADANEIAQFNGLDSSVPLVAGSTIIIPGGEVAAPTTSGTRGTTHRGRKEPYLGGSGPVQDGYYTNPLPGGVLTQGLHGWNAVDIGAARGTPIHAAADGTVIVARIGGYNGGYGNYVVITHENGTQTLYGHMQSVIVSSGEGVSAGQVIGYEGTTGNSTGPHLHFEVRGAANPFRNCSVGSVCEPQ
jgi:murein DD-endopeptidase MepM/ murein hydrolase activator NlpD